LEHAEFKKQNQESIENYKQLKFDYSKVLKELQYLRIQPIKSESISIYNEELVRQFESGQKNLGEAV